MSGYALARPLTIALCAVAFCGCASATTSSPADRAPGYPAPLPAQDLPSGPFTSGQLLADLLDLIRTTQSISALTIEQLSTAMKQPVRSFGPGKSGFSGNLTPNWSFALVLRNAGEARARVDFEFLDGSPRRDTSATEICSLDLDYVASELRAVGFKRETVYGEHGRVMHDRFDRPGFSIEVDSISEPYATSSDSSPRSCVLALRMQ